MPGSYLEHALDYIECHLAEAPTIEEVAQATGVTVEQLRAAFLLIAGMTPARYIRERRLSAAASDLMAGGSVTEVAFRYGYDSVEGFSRAFRSWCGTLPSDVAKLGSHMRSPLHIVVDVKGGHLMEYRIVEKDAFRLAGVMARVPMQFEGENPAIAELARDITGEQRAEMNRLMDTEPRRVVNASWNSDTNFQEEAGELTHLIGVPTIARSAGEGLALVEVPALTWAVFPNDGQHPETMQQTTARIYAEWLAEVPWELEGFRMLSFSDVRDDGTAYSEIWVPVRRKA